MKNTVNYPYMISNTSNEFSNDWSFIQDFPLERKSVIFHEKSKEIEINPVTALAVRVYCIGKVAVC